MGSENRARPVTNITPRYRMASHTSSLLIMKSGAESGDHFQENSCVGELDASNVQAKVQDRRMKRFGGYLAFPCESFETF